MRPDGELTNATAPWPAPVVAAPAVAPGWYPDPRRRAELRWWDGGRWTEHEHHHGEAGRHQGAGPVPLRGALVGIVAFVLARLLVGLALLPLRGGPVPRWIQATAFYVVIFGVMTVVARRGLGLVTTPWRWLWGQLRGIDVGWGLLAWLSAIVAGAVVVTVSRNLGVPFRANGEVIQTYRDRDLPLFAVTAVAGVIGAPLVEELFFRGLLLRGLLDRVPPWAAVFGQGLLFGLYHVIPSYGRANIGLVLVLSTYGWVFGAWAWRSGRLGPTIVGHAVTNALVMTVAFVR